MQRLASCKTAAAALPRLQLLSKCLTAPLVPHRTQNVKGIAVIAAAAAARSQRQQQVPPVPTPRPVQAAEDAFYAEAASSFEQLGIIPAVSDALAAAGFNRPSRVQVRAALGSHGSLVQVQAGRTPKHRLCNAAAARTAPQGRHTICLLHEFLLI
jgi:hypothetical protein